MAFVAFDTLKLADRLEAGGFTAVQARTAASAFADAMSGSDLATKADLAHESAAIRADLGDAKADLRADLVEVEHHLDAKIGAVKADIGRLEERIERRTAESDARAPGIKNELIRWLLGIGVAAIVTIIGTGWTIIRYLPPHL